MNKLWRVLIGSVVLVAVAAGGYLGWQYWQQGRAQASLLKTANESHKGDGRYISFGSNYVFAVAKAHTVDEASLVGVQLLMPDGASALKIDNFDQLFEAKIIAIQPLTQVNPRDGKGLKKYVNETLIPDLEKSVSKDIKVTYFSRGQYQAATIVVNKDGRQVRQFYADSGTNPFLIVARAETEAFTEVASTLIGVEDSKTKDDIVLIKQSIQSKLTLLQEDKIKELYGSGSDDFKKKTDLGQLSNAVEASKSYIQSNIVVPGGIISKDQFASLLSFPPKAGEAAVIRGVIALKKQDDGWRLDTLQLPK